jgi:hypothetical protein
MIMQVRPIDFVDWDLFTSVEFDVVFLGLVMSNPRYCFTTNDSKVEIIAIAYFAWHC